MAVGIQCIVFSFHANTKERGVQFGISDDRLNDLECFLRLFCLCRHHECHLGCLVQGSSITFRASQSIDDLHVSGIPCRRSLLYVIDIVRQIIDVGRTLPRICLLPHLVVFRSDELLVQDSIQIQLMQIGQSFLHLRSLESVDEFSVFLVHTAPSTEGIIEELEIVHPFGEGERRYTATGQFFISVRNSSVVGIADNVMPYFSITSLRRKIPLPSGSCTEQNNTGRRYLAS